MEKTKVGLVGCGNISDTYLKSCPTFEVLEVVACADIEMSRARAQAQKFGLRALTVEELLADPEIEIVVNLTVPLAHAEVNLRALASGKHVHTEKPLAVTRDDGQKTLALAREKNLRVGSAPDTFLGGGLQTCRKMLDDGAIGQPVAATAFVLSHGPESWHPSPDFFYQPGAGPMFDMGPYYLTTLIHLLGPVRRVTGSARVSFSERVAADGHTIQVNTPTHLVGVLDFVSGPVATLMTSFDVWSHHLPRIEIYGSEGTLAVPNPNTFGGPVLLRRAAEKEWREMPLTHGYTANHRGVGVADLAYALHSGRAHRANGEIAYHVLDLMHAIHDASREGQHIELDSTCQRPAALPVGLKEGVLDE